VEASTVVTQNPAELRGALRHRLFGAVEREPERKRADGPELAPDVATCERVRVAGSDVELMASQ